MGKGDAGLVRIVAQVSEIIAHEIGTGLLSLIGKADGILFVILCQCFRGAAGGKGDRGLSLPVVFLATDFGQFDGAGTALLHLRGMHAHMACRFDGKAAR